MKNQGQRAVDAVRNYNKTATAPDTQSILDIMMKGAVHAGHFSTTDPMRDDNVLCGIFAAGSYVAAVIGGHNGLDVFGHEDVEVVKAFAWGAATGLGLEQVRPGDRDRFLPPPPGLNMPSQFSLN